MKNFIGITMAFLIALTYGTAFAGKITCGGTTVSRTLPNGDGELLTVNYTVRNFSNVNTINIKRIVVYDQTGAIRCDAPTIDQLWGTSTPLPVEPHESFSFDTGLFANCHNPITPTPPPGQILQVVITWANGLPGELDVVQVSHARNTTTYSLSSFAFRCEP